MKYKHFKQALLFKVGSKFMLHEIKSSQFVLRNYENLLFVYFVVYNGKMKNIQKVNKIVNLIGFLSLI